MKVSRNRQIDFSRGLQDATTWLMKQPNELQAGLNIRFNEEIGGLRRRDGFTPSGDAFATSKLPGGGHTARFSTGSKRMVACDNAGNTNTVVRVQDSGTGAWSDLITDFPVGSEVFFLDWLDETYVTGYVRATGVPITPRNIDSSLNVSTTRNILNMPSCHYLVEFGGQLFACNVILDSIRYSDRAYESSPPLGAITFIRGAQSGSTGVWKVDSAKYLKVGMNIDVYQAGTDNKIYDWLITSVDKSANEVSITPPTIAYATADVNIASDYFTTPAGSTWITTGTPVLFQSATPPAGLVSGTQYYAIRASTTQVKLALTAADALAGTAIDITSTGTGPHNLTYYYLAGDNDEIWLDGRKGKLTMFWNTDYPNPQAADFLAVQPGTDSDISITGAIKSNNRLFLFTKNSGIKFDGSTLIPFSNSVGCISHRSLRNLEDDWLIWLDAKGNVRARNDASSQQENISKAIRRRIMKRIPQSSLKFANGGTIDSTYKLYVGQIDGDYIRVAYDFDGNTWSVERLGKPANIQITDDSTGFIKPYFYSDNGKLYIDETGNDDDGDVIPMEAQVGKDMFGLDQVKRYTGILIFSNNATGLKVMVAVDGGQFLTVGQIDSDAQYIKFPEVGREVVPDGYAIDTKVIGSLEGEPPTVEGWVHYYGIMEDVPRESRK